ncbi:MAG TPA: hypothetical protein VFU30_05920 [Gaiellaceae bacterium]|nr:hypothetical protein [Gaiellaceae bacterium]
MSDTVTEEILGSRTEPIPDVPDLAVADTAPTDARTLRATTAFRSDLLFIGLLGWLSTRRMRDEIGDRIAGDGEPRDRETHSREVQQHELARLVR